MNAVARARRTDALRFAERVLRASEDPPAGGPSARVCPRGRSAMGLTYAALLRSPVREPDDREHALSWLRKAADAWHAVQSDPASRRRTAARCARSRTRSPESSGSDRMANRIAPGDRR